MCTIRVRLFLEFEYLILNHIPEINFKENPRVSTPRPQKALVVRASHYYYLVD